MQLNVMTAWYVCMEISMMEILLRVMFAHNIEGICQEKVHCNLLFVEILKKVTFD